MILIFGGTTEGRLAAEVAEKAGKRFYYSTLDAAGQIETANGTVLSGGMDAEAMADLCRHEGIRGIVDAAHPFATALHAEVARASSMTGIPVIRLERVYPPRRPDIEWCRDWDDALDRLEQSGVGRLLVLSGVKTIARLRPFWQERPGCRFRILDRPSSRRLALAQGVEENRLLYYDPSVPEDEVLRRIAPEAIITKESGESGGFEAKVEAALALGIRVFAVCRPEMPEGFVTVTGRHGLRRAIERLVPGFFDLRSGFTTGACATAAAKGALQALLTGNLPDTVEFELPDGEWMEMPVESVSVLSDGSARAVVVKDHSDDPDVTRGARIVCTVRLTDGDEVTFAGGEGVGTVTLPGVGIDPGEPAINPVPRAMMTREARRLYPAGGVQITVSVPGGAELTEKTFNPRIGISGGISIIGTSGVVSPFSHEAFVEAMRREMEVAVAMGAERIVLNSGARSERAVKALYPDLPPQAFIHYGNAVGDAVRLAAGLGVGSLTVSMMIGKAVKLAAGNLDTHSHNVTMDRGFLSGLAREAGCSAEAMSVIEGLNMASELWDRLAPADLALFIPALRQRCLNALATLHPRITLLLLTPAGSVAP